MHDHLSNNNEFSLILEILERDDLDPELKDHISNRDPVTFLAPSDKAILSFLEEHPMWRTVRDIPSETINNIIRNHLVINGNIVLADLYEDIIMTSAYGQELTIHIDYPEWSVLNESKKQANLSIRNIQAVNGIIHQADRVLMQ